MTSNLSPCSFSAATKRSYSSFSHEVKQLYRSFTTVRLASA